jgi:hypothetical protein
VASDFKETGRGKLAEQALANSEWDAREVFFALKRIVARVSYIDALTKAKQQAEQKAEQK